MSPPLIRVDSDETLPAAADVVVIGGGIVGVCTAYTLARRGISVALVEKGRIGAEQSSRNWGWCRQLNRDERELPLATRSLEIWDQLSADIGEDLGFRRCGLIYLSNDEQEIATWSAWSDFARPRGVDTRILTGEAATELGRATRRQWKGGVHSPTDGTADPSRAAPLIARGVRKHGGTVHQSVAARGIETEAGRVGAVVTEAGTIRTSAVVMAGGAWASSFCRQLGITFPQATIRSSVMRFGPGANDVPAALYTSDAAITRRGDGSFAVALPWHAAFDPTPQSLRHARHFIPMLWKRRRTLWPGNLQGWAAGHETLRRWRLDEVTPMERVRILDPRPSEGTIAETVRRARAVMPAFCSVEPVQSWAGYIDSTPDGVPVIAAIEALPGFVLAAGFSGHGFGIGPAAGEMAADVATGSAPALAAAYRLDRFARRQKVSEF